MREKKSEPNQKIREAMKKSGLRYWQLADLIEISTGTLSVWMRHEMPEEKQERILQLIKEEAERMHMRMPAEKQNF